MNKNQTEATFRCKVKNLKDEVNSQPFYIHNLPWKIVAKIVRIEKKKYLGYYLLCCWENESNWSCYAKAELRIIPNNPNSKTFYRAIKHRFCRNENYAGIDTFKVWQKIITNRKQYIKNKSFTLEVHVIAEMPLNIGYEKSTLSSSYCSSSATDTEAHDCTDNVDGSVDQKKCGANETYLEPEAQCVPRQRSELGMPISCPDQPQDGSCPEKPGCVCIDGFVRDENNVCIPSSDCQYGPEIVSVSPSQDQTGLVMEVGGYKLGSLIIEGKTKQVFDLPEVPGHCLLLNKDRITAGDGVKAHDLEGKAAISNQTNAKVFEILNATGLKTAYVKMASPTAFVSKKCEMIPIEWVTRRLATGSFLKRNPGVPEGFRFTPPKQETFYKDDANHDPQWSEEQIICAKFNVNGLVIGRDEVDYMRKATILVFEILEKAWALRDCALIDMKIEFGVDIEGNILLADVIDSDSWRLWPSGDKRLMVDKQVYRNLSTVTAADLDTVKRNFAWVKDQLDNLKPNIHHKVVVFMGSPADQEHCQKIATAARELGLEVDLRVTSAHKATEETLRIMQEYEDTHGALVFIAVAGRSNGLGPVLSGNTSYPVINCPPPSDKLVQDIWSSLSVPSGLGCATVIYPDSAALMAAQIIGLQDYLVWARLRVKQLGMAASLRQADKKLRNLKV